jgi:hypothetical protein
MGQHGFRRTGTFQEDELKVCDLCGSLNLASNTDCFVCGWRGHFERSHDAVRTAVEIAVQHYGRLELDNLTDIQTYREIRHNMQSRFWAWCTVVWRWLSG